MVDKCISKKLDSIYEPISTVTTVPKQIIHCKIPFMSNFLNKQLNSEVVKIFPPSKLTFVTFVESAIPLILASPLVIIEHELLSRGVYLPERNSL